MDTDLPNGFLQGYDGLPQEAEYNLVVAKLTTGKIITHYPLEGTPTCLDILKSGKQVAIGLEEGRTVVFILTTKGRLKSAFSIHNNIV